MGHEDAIARLMARKASIASPWGTISRYNQRGRIRYRLRGVVDGREQSCGLYDTIEEARKAAAAMASAMTGRPRELTVYRWAMDACDAREHGHLRGVAETRRVLRQHVAGSSIAQVPLRALRPEQVRAWIHGVSRKKATRGKRQGQPLGGQTVANALRALSTVLTDAVEAGKLTRNPCLGIRPPKVPRDEEAWTYLEAHEVERIINAPLLEKLHTNGSKKAEAGHALPLYQRTAYTLAIFTGLRAGELWGLRWRDVRLDGANPEVSVCRSYGKATKGGRTRRVQLLPPAEAALRAWRERGGVTRMTGLVFPGETSPTGVEETHKKGYTAQWPTWRKRLGLRPEVRFHDLRHTCASHLVMGTWGRPWRLEEVQIWLGHASRSTTERYARLAPESIVGAARQAREMWDG